MNRFGPVACVVVMVGTLAGTAQAAPLTPDAGWYDIDWNCVPLGSGCTATPSDGFYEFTLSQAGILRLTDLFTAGDRFDVSVTPQGGSTVTQASSALGPGDAGFQPCPDFEVQPCQSIYGQSAWYSPARDALGNFYFNDGHYSTLEWALGPGTYTVEFALLALAPDVNDRFPGDFQTEGLAGVRVDTVPEPASLLLLSTGVAGVVARRRKKSWQSSFGPA